MRILLSDEMKTKLLQSTRMGLLVAGKFWVLWTISYWRVHSTVEEGMLARCWVQGILGRVIETLNPKP